MRFAIPVGISGTGPGLSWGQAFLLAIKRPRWGPGRSDGLAGPALGNRWLALHHLQRVLQEVGGKVAGAPALLIAEVEQVLTHRLGHGDGDALRPARHALK